MIEIPVAKDLPMMTSGTWNESSSLVVETYRVIRAILGLLPAMETFLPLVYCGMSSSGDGGCTYPVFLAWYQLVEEWRFGHTMEDTTRMMIMSHP